jgi:membrane-bound lytic murein transglycosylase B
MIRLRNLISIWGMAIFLAASPLFAATPGDKSAEFETWLEGLRAEARVKGISNATLDAAFAGVAPIARVIELDRRQPEFTQTFWGYLDRRATEQRIERGRELLRQHEALLRQVEARYGVQPRFLVAFWGLESNFGDYTGNMSVIGALATLAYDERRADFFRSELFNALAILEAGHITPQAMQGSWAGAMGQVQFMPSTFMNYAVDFDGDGRRDIWNSLPDIFGSAANFLSKINWDGERTWGREVRLPTGFNWDLAGLDRRKPLSDWRELGVRRADGGDLPDVEVDGSVVLPAGHRGPAFLVYGNYRVILNWNRSTLFAISVGHLSDRIKGEGPLLAARPAEERALSRKEVKELQGRLLALGFDPGTPDGVLGSRTRAALRAYQRSAGLPADGYPHIELLETLRRSGDG